jgi:hypothetical protein
VVIESSRLDLSLTLTILTTLTNLVLVIVYLESNNTQHSFLDFVRYVCEYGYLVQGDIFIVDNGAIHCGEDTLEYCYMMYFRAVLLSTAQVLLLSCCSEFSADRVSADSVKFQQIDFLELKKKCLFKTISGH